MANNQKFTLTFDANLKVGQVESAIGQIQKALNDLHLSGNITRGLNSTFEKLSDEITNFKALTSKEVTSTADFNKIEKSAEKIDELYSKLRISIKDLSSRTGKDLEKLFPESLVRNISSAQKAIDDYTKKQEAFGTKISETEKNIEGLEKELKEVTNKPIWDDEKKAQLANASKELKQTKEELENVKQELVQFQNATDINDPIFEKYGDINNVIEAEQKLEQKTQELLELRDQLSIEKRIKFITVEKQAESLKKINADLQQARENLKNLEEEKKKFEDASLEGGGLNLLINKISELTGKDVSKIGTDISSIKQELKTFSSEQLEKLAKGLQEASGSAEDAKGAIRILREAVGEFGGTVQKTTDQLGEVEQLKKRITYFFGLNNTIQLVKRTMKSAISTIKELDAAMTATAVVTDFTVADMWEQLPEYTKRANELGVSTKAAYEAATLYYQQGLKTNEVMAISNETLKMARIAGLDAATATDRVTNAIRGFNMAINEVNAQRINDVYSRLAAISASNVDEISTAMTKVASLANSANMEFETTAAFLAQIVETTRESAETAGTALKTVIARFSEVKKLYSENELRGTDEEGLEIDVNKISTALRTAGIDLNKYFLGEVGLDDIFMELASKWDKLTSVQQRYIATQAAGSRQQSRFIALMSNYARTQELVGEAYNANGAAAKQFAKTQESLESKLARLKNAWNEFAMGILNSDLTKFFVEALTKVLDFVNQLTTLFGKLDGGIGGVISSLLKLTTLVGGLSLGKGLLNKAFGGTLGQAGGVTGAIFSQPSLFKKIGSGAKSLWGGIQSIGLNSIGATGLRGIAGKAGEGAASIFGTSAASTGFAAGLSGILTVAAPLAAIAATAISIKSIINEYHKVSLEGQVEAAENYAAALSKIADNAKSAAEGVKSVQADYTKYSEAIDEAQTSGARAKAIKDRNEYITSLLEQNKEYQKYLSTTFEGGQIKLVLDEDAIANAVEKAAEVAQRMGAYSDLSSAVAEQTKVNLYKDKLEGIDFKKGQRTFSYTDEYGSHQVTYKLSEEEKTKYQTYQNLLNQATSQMEILAKQGISQLMTKGLLSDEVIDSASSFLAKNFVGSDYTEQLFNYKQAVEDLKLDSGGLKDYYKQVLGVEPDDELKDEDLIAAIAEKQMFDANTQELINNLETLITDIRYKESFENILAATSGKGKINEINIAEYINENGELNEATLDKFYDKLGFSVLNTDQLSGITGAYIANAREQIKQQAILINNVQKVNKANIFRNLLQSGAKVTGGLQSFVKNLNPERARAISDITTKAKDLLSEKKYSNLLGGLESGLGSSENLTEIQDFFNSFNLDNPINAFLQLKEAEKQAQDSGDEFFESLVNDVKESNSAILSTSNLLKTFVQSSEYDELYEDLHKFIEENGRLTPDKIDELAKSSKAFNAVLESSDNAVNGLAKALVAIDRGAPLEGLTQRVLESLDSVESVDDALWRMYDTIDNFDAGRAYSEGTEFISKQLETFQELVDKRAFAGPQFKNIGELLFGENFVNYLKKYPDKTVDEIAALWQERIDQLQSDITYDSFGFLTRMASDGNDLGISFKLGSIEDFNWEVGDLTSKELSKKIAEYAKVSDKAADMILAGAYDHIEGLKDSLDENNFNAALKSFAADIDKSTVVTQQELDAWAAAFENGAEKVKKAIKDKTIDASKIVDWTGLNGQEITDKIIKDFSNLSDLFEEGTFEFLGNKFYDADKLVSTLQEYLKLTPEQAKDAVGPLTKELGHELAKEVQVQVFKNNEWVVEPHLARGSTYDELQQDIERIYKEADYNILVDSLVNADWEKVGNAIVEGILKATSGKNPLEKIINQYEEVKKYIEKNPIQINTTSSLGTNNINNNRIKNGVTYLSQASGDSFLTTPGWALTGEEGPEIVWNKEKGYSYITGQDGPEFRSLQIGDKIFNAQDTSRILKHSSFAKGGVFGSAGGGYDTDYPSSSGSGGSSKQPTKWRNELDWLYNLMEDIAELERTQTKLQEQHDRYLQDISKTGRDLYTTSNEQLNNLRTQLDNQREALVRRRQEMGEQLQASGYNRYVWWNSKDQTIEIDWDAIEAIQNKDTYDAVSDLVSKVEKIQDEMDAAADALWDIEDTIKEIENRYLEEYTNFQKRIYDAVVNSYQQQIDKLSQLNDTINDSNNAILNSLQHEIELQRQIRDNTDTENNIRDMEARLAYLRRDTTGANESEIRALEKQLEEARQNYADTLIDQSIARLQENNDKAAEQREKQISLLTAQLDYWKETGALWPEVATLLESGFSKDGAIIGGSALEQILQEAEGWKAMSEQQREVWANELITSANQAGAYLLKISEGFDNLSAGIWALIPNSSLTTEKYQYATGGLASYTGPAWLDGTPREPEYVLNARQTDAFLRLAEVLPSMFANQGTTVNNLGHDIYVEFNMNVDKIASDYDVDRIVDRVKEDIYNISSYGNVNSISFSR